MAKNNNDEAVGWAVYERWMEMDDSSNVAYIVSHPNLEDAIRHAKEFHDNELPAYFTKRWFVVVENRDFYQRPEIVDSLAKAVINSPVPNAGQKGEE